MASTQSVFTTQLFSTLKIKQQTQSKRWITSSTKKHFPLKHFRIFFSCTVSTITLILQKIWWLSTSLFAISCWILMILIIFRRLLCIIRIRSWRWRSIKGFWMSTKLRLISCFWACKILIWMIWDKVSCKTKSIFSGRNIWPCWSAKQEFIGILRISRVLKNYLYSAGKFVGILRLIKSMLVTRFTCKIDTLVL